MALIKIIPPGPTWPPVHKRAYKLVIVKGRLLIKKRKTTKSPKADKPPAPQHVKYGTWWLKARRRYTALMGHDWKTADLPKNQAYWAALAATVPIINYKGNLVTVNGFEWWMWYTWMTMVAANAQRFPYDPTWAKPWWYPRLPWAPPATPDAVILKANSPADFEVGVQYEPDASTWDHLFCFWIGLHPATQTNIPPTKFIECYSTSVHGNTGWWHIPLDFSTLVPTVRPGESAVLGWAIFYPLHKVAGVWKDFYQIGARRWLHFNFA